MSDDEGLELLIAGAIIVGGLILGKLFSDSLKKYRCPRCNYPVAKSDIFCPNCHQPIDWSSVKE